MKTPRFAFVITLLAACSSPDNEVGPRLGGACSDSASVTRTELEAGGVLCENQTLVAAIHPGDDLKFTVRILTPGDVDLCFDDDDAEPHEASLRGTTVAAQTPCQTVSLPAGDHTLGLRHALREVSGKDDRSDVLHTKWTPPTSTSRGRLQLTSNACPRCLLDKPWPELDGPQFYGYAGDYTDAIITGRCDHPLPQFCVLGGSMGRSSFDRARIVLHPDDGNTRYLIGGADDATVSTFRGATVTAGSEALFAFADATGAKVAGDGPRLSFGFGTNLAGVDITEYRGGKIVAEQCRMDVAMYSRIVARGADGSACTKSTVTVPKGQSLAGMILAEGATAGSNLFVWPHDESGILSMPDTSFEKATLRNLTIPCPHGGDLRRASFIGATLDTVSLTGCNLTDARFAGSTLTNVTAAKGTSLLRADLTNVKVDGLDVTEASMSGATLTNAPNSPWIGLVAHQLTAGSLHAQGLVMALDGKGHGPDFSLANLPAADFSGAQLPRAVFAGATLTTTNFSGALLVGANFEASNGTGPIFEKADLQKSTASAALLTGVRFVSPNFRGASLQGAKLTYARVCGGDFGGAHLEGANLTQTPLPLVSDKFTTAGEGTFDCVEITDLTTVVNDATTVCPDGTPGPCTGAAWVPSNFVPQCTAGPRKKSGFSCMTPCECALLTCLNGTCG